MYHNNTVNSYSINTSEKNATHTHKYYTASISNQKNKTEAHNGLREATVQKAVCCIVGGLLQHSCSQETKVLAKRKRQKQNKTPLSDHH